MVEFTNVRIRTSLSGNELSNLISSEVKPHLINRIKEVAQFLEIEVKS